ncbi:MAG: SDR family NAD(P)-dependent oxidoreductase [Deltaproteobacteria bacterium]|nr:SDR family NAD(P)-dependent oxidoreductase [Deltaproteobacteria bacterium]MBW2397909.1 SDR family NAD(P)-dependent oxidoreductase [Deltaproteobacteria bacterium]MBW2665109.1 SDR family NAD(P)-dependent oxidoreductase [Deltaproteobacteria bacterium]
MDDLAGKVAFVTGGASGIGLALAQAFAGEGAKIVLADIEVGALEKAEESLRADGAEVIGVRCDVSDPESVKAAGARAVEAFEKIHILCNNAGVAPSGAMDETTPDDWNWCLGVNLMGVVHGCQSIVPLIKQHGEGGHVVNTASVAGLMALPTLGIYTATKYAVVGISETLRGELAPFDIGVSVLCPSFVKTQLNTSHRNRPAEYGPGEPDEFMTQILPTGTEPSVIAERVIRGIKRGDLYILPHPDLKAGFQARADEILAAFDLD